MANLVLIYVVHHVFNMYMGKGKPSFIRYIAVVMEMLLLGYERLAETALQLMHCVSIGSGKWLFIDANVPCLQWWQYLILSYTVIFLCSFHHRPLLGIFQAVQIFHYSRGVCRCLHDSTTISRILTCQGKAEKERARVFWPADHRHRCYAHTPRSFSSAKRY